MPTPAEDTLTQDPSHQAQAFLSLLWRHIYLRVQMMLHPHAPKHGPGGNDPIKLPIGFLHDVELVSLANGDTLIYDSATEKWINGEGDAGSPHQVHFSVILPPVTIPPGPTNITGDTLTITATNFSSDGAVSGSISPGGSFGFGAGGGSDRTDGLAIPWGDGDTMTVAITSSGEATYVAIDVAVI
jgi:hypothetical protein